MERMTWEQILNRAIAKEREAHSNYLALAGWVKDPGSQQMLRDLAEEERKHKEILEKWQGGKIPGSPPSYLARSGSGWKSARFQAGQGPDTGGGRTGSHPRRGDGPLVLREPRQIVGGGGGAGLRQAAGCGGAKTQVQIGIASGHGMAGDVTDERPR